SMSRHTRATTVVNQPARLSTLPAPVRLSLIHASCTASSASLSEPSIRYATERRLSRFSSNSCTCQSLRVMSHPLVAARHRGDVHDNADVTGGSSVIEVRSLRKTY